MRRAGSPHPAEGDSANQWRQEWGSVERHGLNAVPYAGFPLPIVVTILNAGLRLGAGTALR